MSTIESDRNSSAKRGGIPEKIDVLAVPGEIKRGEMYIGGRKVTDLMAGADKKSADQMSKVQGALAAGAQEVFLSSPDHLYRYTRRGNEVILESLKIPAALQSEVLRRLGGVPGADGQFEPVIRGNTGAGSSSLNMIPKILSELTGKNYLFKFEEIKNQARETPKQEASKNEQSSKLLEVLQNSARYNQEVAAIGKNLKITEKESLQPQKPQYGLELRKHNPAELMIEQKLNELRYLQQRIFEEREKAPKKPTAFVNEPRAEVKRDSHKDKSLFSTVKTERALPTEAMPAVAHKVLGHSEILKRPVDSKVNIKELEGNAAKSFTIGRKLDRHPAKDRTQLRPIGKPANYAAGPVNDSKRRIGNDLLQRMSDKALQAGRGVTPRTGVTGKKDRPREIGEIPYRVKPLDQRREISLPEPYNIFDRKAPARKTSESSSERDFKKNRIKAARSNIRREKERASDPKRKNGRSEIAPGSSDRELHGIKAQPPLLMVRRQVRSIRTVFSRLSSHPAISSLTNSVHKGTGKLRAEILTRISGLKQYLNKKRFPLERFMQLQVSRKMIAAIQPIKAAAMRVPLLKKLIDAMRSARMTKSIQPTRRSVAGSRIRRRPGSVRGVFRSRRQKIHRYELLKRKLREIEKLRKEELHSHELIWYLMRENEKKRRELEKKEKLQFKMRQGQAALPLVQKRQRPPYTK